MAYVYINPYKSGYLAAQTELEHRKAELDFVTRRIKQLEETIAALAPLANETAESPTVGLSEICAQVLISLAGIGVTASDMVNSLGYRGIDVSGYSNPLSVIHTTLTRLCKPGTGFVKGKTPSGEPLYSYDPVQDNSVRMGRLGDMVGGVVPGELTLPPPPGFPSEPFAEWLGPEKKKGK